MPLRTLLFSAMICFMYFPGFAKHVSDNNTTRRIQSTKNNCAVVASFTPDHDSLIAGPLYVQFASTSKNASSYKWLTNGLFSSSDNTMNYSLSAPGIYEFKLIAYNGSCSDTASCVYFYPGTQPADRNNIKAYYGVSGVDDYSTTFVALKEGGYVMGGYSQPYSSLNTNGLIIKITESGCIQWTKIIPDQFTGKLTKIIQCQDGGLAVTGYTNTGYYLLKLDTSGNLLWSKTYEMEGESIEIASLTSTSDNGLILAGGYGMFSNTSMEIIRTNSKGDIIWTKGFFKKSYSYTYQGVVDVMQRGNDIYLLANVRQIETPANPDTLSAVLIKMNDQSQLTEWSKKISINGKTPYLKDIHLYGDNLLLNFDGNGNVFSAPTNSFTVMDADANVIKSSTIILGDINYPVLFSSAMPMDNGDIYFFDGGIETLQLQPLYAFHSFFIKLDKNDNVKWSKHYGSVTKGRYFNSVIGQNKTFAALGDEVGGTNSQYGYYSDQFMFLKIDSAGGSPGSGDAGCALRDSKVSVISNTAKLSPFNWSREYAPSARATDTVYNVRTTYTSAFFYCPNQFVDSCSYIKLTGPGNVCNLSDTFVYKTHRNRTCNQPVEWDIPKNAIVIAKTDTALILKFTALGKYTVGASLSYTCSPVKDSVDVTVGSRSLLLNLGNDTSICLNSKVVLHAGPLFTNYLWQDGSKDSLFSVTQSGSYWVQVSDSCGNVLSDTINISIAAKLLLSIGPDRMKCNNDTVQLIAPSGFLNYSWSNNYNISSLTGQTVIVNPAVDTSYFLKAEKTPGCFGFDTIAIKVNHSPKINLGADTSICNGDHILINAGADFTDYLWSTGATTPSITAASKGTYFVAGTTSDGCRSYDTIRVLSIFNNPTVQLNKDSTLCAGGTRLLDAGGNYTSYLWYDGSSGKTFTVKAPGTYTIIVKDVNGCIAKDSVKVSTILDLPKNFLPVYASICSYGSLVINTLKNYNKYLWSTNETTGNITIKKPGDYTLQVTDVNGCAGADTIHVMEKQCLEGIYVPTAFTPNGDGKNDLFKPQIFGNVVSYRFVIYNRYGGKVFETTDTNKGWNGNIANASVQTGGYVWTCRFQFAGQQPRLEKGIVIIIR